MKEYVKMLSQNADVKFIVFAHHRIMLDSITEQLVDGNVTFIRIDGSTLAVDRPVRQNHPILASLLSWVFLIILFNFTLIGKASLKVNCWWWFPTCNRYFRKFCEDFRQYKLSGEFTNLAYASLWERSVLEEVMSKELTFFYHCLFGERNSRRLNNWKRVCGRVQMIGRTASIPGQGSN